MNGFMYLSGSVIHHSNIFHLEREHKRGWQSCKPKKNRYIRYTDLVGLWPTSKFFSLLSINRFLLRIKIFSFLRSSSIWLLYLSLGNPVLFSSLTVFIIIIFGTRQLFILRTCSSHLITCTLAMPTIEGSAYYSCNSNFVLFCQLPSTLFPPNIFRKTVLYLQHFLIGFFYNPGSTSKEN